jgi:hypothetical protein
MFCIYALMMFEYYLKMINIDRNITELWKIMYKKYIISTLDYLLVLFCEFFINARTWITLRTMSLVETT